MAGITRDQMIAAILLSAALIALVAFTNSLQKPALLVVLVLGYVVTLIFVERWIKSPL